MGRFLADVLEGCCFSDYIKIPGINFGLVNLSYTYK